MRHVSRQLWRNNDVVKGNGNEKSYNMATSCSFEPISRLDNSFCQHMVHHVLYMYARTCTCSCTCKSTCTYIHVMKRHLPMAYKCGLISHWHNAWTTVKMLYGVHVTINANRMALNVLTAFFSCFFSCRFFLARWARIFALFEFCMAMRACIACRKASVLWVKRLPTDGVLG